MKAIYQERMSENMEQRMRLRILLLLDGRPHGDMLTLEDAWASMRKNIRNHFGRNDDEWVNPHMSLNDYEQLFRRVWLEVQQELAAF